MRNPLPLPFVQYPLPFLPGDTSMSVSQRQIPMWDHFDMEDQPKCNLCSATFSKDDRLAVFKTHLKNKHNIDVDASDAPSSSTPISTPGRRPGLRSSTRRPISYAETSPRSSPIQSPTPIASQVVDPDYPGTQDTAATTDTQRSQSSEATTALAVATRSRQSSESTVTTSSTEHSYTPVNLLHDSDFEEQDEAPFRSTSPAGPPSVHTVTDSDTYRWWRVYTPPPRKKRHRTGSQNINNVANKPFDSWRDDSSWIVKKAEARDLDVRFAKNRIEITQEDGKSLIFIIKDAFVVVKTLDSDGDLEKKDKWQKGAGFVPLVLGTIDVTFEFL